MRIYFVVWGNASLDAERPPGPGFVTHKGKRLVVLFQDREAAEKAMPDKQCQIIENSIGGFLKACNAPGLWYPVDGLIIDDTDEVILAEAPA